MDFLILIPTPLAEVSWLVPLTITYLFPVFIFYSTGQETRANARGYGHERFAGEFTIAQRQSEPTVSVANAGAKPANTTSASQCA